MWCDVMCVCVCVCVRARARPTLQAKNNAFYFPCWQSFKLENESQFPTDFALNKIRDLNLQCQDCFSMCIAGKQDCSKTHFPLTLRNSHQYFQKNYCLLWQWCTERQIQKKKSSINPCISPIIIIPKIGFALGHGSVLSKTQICKISISSSTCYMVGKAA